MEIGKAHNGSGNNFLFDLFSTNESFFNRICWTTPQFQLFYETKSSIFNQNLFTNFKTIIYCQILIESSNLINLNKLIGLQLLKFSSIIIKFFMCLNFIDEIAFFITFASIKLLSHHFSRKKSLFAFPLPITLNYFVHMCAEHVGFLSTEIEKMSSRINAVRVENIFLDLHTDIKLRCDWRMEGEKVNKFEVVKD